MHVSLNVSISFCFSDGEGGGAGNGRAVRRNSGLERRASLCCCNACKVTGRQVGADANLPGVEAQTAEEISRTVARAYMAVFFCLLLFCFLACVCVCACVPRLVLLLVGLCNQVAKTENT